MRIEITEETPIDVVSVSHTVSFAQMDAFAHGDKSFVTKMHDGLIMDLMHGIYQKLVDDTTGLVSLKNPYDNTVTFKYEIGIIRNPNLLKVANVDELQAN